MGACAPLGPDCCGLRCGAACAPRVRVPRFQGTSAATGIGRPRACPYRAGNRCALAAEVGEHRHMPTQFDPPSGTRDFLAAEWETREHAFERIRLVFARYGFEPLVTPAFERLDRSE